MFCNWLVFTTCMTLVATVPLDPNHRQVRHFGTNPWRENLLKWINFPLLKEPANQRHSFGSRDVYASYQAMTFGSGHMITFDGKYYHIPDGIGASCPHILSRDQAKFRFMILRSSSSITLYTTNTVITLHNNNKVEVNNTGVYRDLPVQSWDDSASVTHDNEAVVIDTNIGVMIECDLHHTECLYRLTGSYYNHTTGLLGTNDGDASNDLLLPSGRVAAHLQEFINYYELSGSSVCRPAATTTGEKCTSELTSRCQHLFSHSTSQLAACYEAVDPEPFMLACIRDMESCDTSQKMHKMCDAVRAYIKMCQFSGLSMQSPRECNRCHRHHSIDSTWSEEIHKKLDIVLATSLNRNVLPSNRSIGSVLSNVLEYVIRILRNDAGLHNLRVGLLGFGGKGYLNKPHVYTVQGEAFTRHYNAAIWRQTLSSLEANGIWNTDPLTGLKKAVNYPFREDAVKMIILLSEQAPNVQETDSLMAQLQSKGVILNVITSSDPERYSSKVGRLHIRRDIAELVQHSQGSVFDIHSISSDDTYSMQQMGQKILQQVKQNIHSCRRCTCRSTVLGSETSVCEEKRCT